MAKIQTSAFVLVVLTMMAGSVAAEERAVLETDELRTAYAYGALLARQIAPYHFDDAELQALHQGLVDALRNRELEADPADYRQKITGTRRGRTRRAGEREREASKDFLAAAESEPGAVKLESGLIYTEVQLGDGESPTDTSTVTVHYEGTLRDGTVFDGSRSRGEPATFPLNRVIPCWTEGLQRMKVGGRSVLVCPDSIGYGDRGFPPKIGPGAALRFEVELLGVEQPEPVTSSPGVPPPSQ